MTPLKPVMHCHSLVTFEQRQLLGWCCACLILSHLQLAWVYLEAVLQCCNNGHHLLWLITDKTIYDHVIRAIIYALAQLFLHVLADQIGWSKQEIFFKNKILWKTLICTTKHRNNNKILKGDEKNNLNFLIFLANPTAQKANYFYSILFFWNLG